MSLLCQSCGKHPGPFPLLQTWQEDVNNLKAHQIPAKYHPGLDTSSFRITVDALAAYVENLKTELEVASKLLKTTQSILAPISRLSDDILLCIFEELFTNSDPRPWKTYDIYPYTLVCKRWREVITSTPKFWTKIDFPKYYDPLTDLPNASLRRYFGAQLGYSAMLPLELVCSGGFAKESLDALQPAFNRIISLTISPEYIDEMEDALSASICLQNLNRVSITMTPPKFDPVFEDGPLDIYIHHPNLRHIELELGYVLGELDMPWARLTTLRIRLHCGGTFNPCDMMSELTRIEDLSLDMGYHYEAEFPEEDWPEVNLQRLHTLKLALYNSVDFPFRLPQQSTLPNLKKLNYSLTRCYQEFIEVMNTPQLWSLVELRLSFIKISDRFEATPDLVEEVMNSLREFKSLEILFLDIQVPHAVDRVLQVLSKADMSKGYLLPYLRSLEITGAPLSQNTPTSLREMLENRVSRIETPVEARRALRAIFLSFDYKSEAHQGRCKFTKQEWRPSQYNDRATSVQIVARGELPAEFLRESLVACHLY